MAPAAARTSVAVAPRRGPERATLLALALGTAGVVYRAALLGWHTPPPNSDEATIGLAALHIARGHDFPAFFYGQHYMGTVEAWLAAPLVALIGHGDAALRAPLLLLYAVFLIAMYRLTRRVYPTGLAVAVVALLALGSDRVVKDQLIAGGGYPEIAAAGALLFGIAAALGTGAARRRGPLFAVWGLLAGLCVWDDWLVLPYVAAAGVVLVATCRRELWGRAGALLAGGLLVGAAPLIGYELTARAGQDSLSVYLNLSHAGHAALADRLFGGIVFGIPMATGLCSPSHCAPVQLWFGWGYVALLAVALVLAVRSVRRATGRDRAVHVVRLGLLGAAGLTLLLYARSPAAGETPVESARYLHLLLISTPAVLWPLWSAAARWRGWRRLAGALPLGALLVTALVASVALVGHVPAYAAGYRRQQRLVAALDRLGVTRIYAPYWTCDRLAYATGERVVCAVVTDDLGHGTDRVPGYRAAVAAASHPAYVLPTGSPVERRFAEVLAAAGTPAAASDVAGYRIFRPAARIAPRS